MLSRARRVYDILIGVAVAASLAVAVAHVRAQGAPAAVTAEERAEHAAFHSVGEWLRTLVPQELRGGGFLVENWQWIGIGAAIFLGWLFSYLIGWIAFLIGRPVFHRLVPGGDPQAVRRNSRALGLFVGAWIAHAGLLALSLPKEVLEPLTVAVSFVTAAAAVLTFYRFVDLLSAHFAARARDTASRAEDLLVPLVRKALKVAVLAFGVVFVAGSVHVDISSLLTGLGLGGLAFALAAQDTVKNLFGSVTVLLDRPFQVGDRIKIGDVEGVVEEVGLRSTRVRTLADSLVTVPNANLISSSVENLGARRRRRWQTRLSVAYGTAPDKIVQLCDGIRELAQKSKDVSQENVEAWANDFNGTAIEILISLHFVAPGLHEELAARHRVLLEILKLAEQLEIPLGTATPPVVVHTSPPMGTSPLPDPKLKPKESKETSAPALSDKRTG